MACVAVTSLVRTIEVELLRLRPRPIVQEKGLIPPNKDLIQSLRRKLSSLIKLFDENRMDGAEAIKDLETKLRDVAFTIEDEIEFQIAQLYQEEEEEEERTSPALKLCHVLQQAIEDIDSINKELEKIKEDKSVEALQGRMTTLDVFPRSDEVIMTGDSSQHASHSQDKMVGKNNEFERVKKMLIEHSSKQREVVSIKGMGGIGKTTLARRVYDDPEIASNFDKKTWVVASQNHNKRQLLISLLKSISGKEETGPDEEIALHLYQGLKGQRYMVVIDDLWSNKAWDAVKICLPNDSQSSRVLVTTRFAEVAAQIGSNSDFSHQMQFLDPNESWNLFYEKACKCRGAEFEAIGRPIVEKCQGLPLAIVVVAGLFSKLVTLDEWKNMAKTLINSSVTTVDEECSRILVSSYNQLHYNLKACFLYLGIFPEDKEIFVKNLARLWAAEGFIKTSKKMSFDLVATINIHELNDRNLILVSQVSSCGGKIKAFRIHDLLHSFCVREAQKENLLHVVHENSSNLPQKGFRWVSFHSKDPNSPAASYTFPKTCRSIFSFSGKTPLDLKVCNLLRVLYGAEGEIANLVHLRYLGSKPSDFEFLEPACAWNLQTLSTSENDKRNCLLFPHLEYCRCGSISSCFPEFVHQRLENISWLKPAQCTRELFKKIPYLKKVNIKSEGRAWNDWYCDLSNLKYLESLQICERNSILAGAHRAPIRNRIFHLKQLKKLTFHGMYFVWKEISVFSSLPKLEVLKLRGCSCIDEEWKLSEDEIFKQLAYLEIHTTRFKRWEARNNHFPNLQHLILSGCYKLEEIPVGFGEIGTLELIKIKYCLPSVVESAKQILEEQHDAGNDNMFVIEEGTLKPAQSNEDDESDEDEFD
ncbi:putative late blight resistance protein homolog R1A-3, partial [Ipomoea triloba]|uniref:putative late blight resistance protein homolog R1A-3 n=1 Tax=Ipomoea triloba TaxID=35885 RepID=UPI00125DE167